MSDEGRTQFSDGELTSITLVLLGLMAMILGWVMHTNASRYWSENERAKADAVRAMVEGKATPQDVSIMLAMWDHNSKK